MKKQVINRTIILLLIIGCLGYLFNPLFKNLSYGLDLKGGFEVLYKVIPNKGEKIDKDMIKSTYLIMLKRIDNLGVSEPEITIEGDERIRVRLAGVTDEREAREILSSVANLSFRDTNDNLLMTSSVLKNNSVKLAADSSGKPAVALGVKDKDTFYKVTNKVKDYQDNRIVIWLDFNEETDSFKKEESKCGSLDESRCLSVATVSEGFASDVIIQGNFTKEAAESLATMINSGSLDVKLEEISSKTVGATFGENSLTKTLTAGIIGIGLISIALMYFYRFSGFVSSVSLIIYTFLTFLTYKLVGGVLTLPGIAATILGIGMAIDSCVITNERIKEELSLKKGLKTAFMDGKKRSLVAIVDGNLTTLLIAIILFILGESNIKGFATMLIISIFLTALIMVLLNNYLLGLFVKTKYFDKKIKNFINYKERNLKVFKISKLPIPFMNLDFIKYRKYFYTIISLIFVVAITLTFFNGFNFGVDFKGGTTISIMSEKKITEKTLKNDIEKLDLEYNSFTYENNVSNIIIKDFLNKEKINKVKTYFEDKYDSPTEVMVISQEVRQELTRNAIFAIILAFIGVAVYVSIRFRFDYAVTSLIALIHDAAFVILFFAVFQIEISTMFIAAILAIIGYSINDTIVCFDRIRENLQIEYKNKLKSKAELEDLVNNSMRQTFSRTILTSFTTLLPIMCLVLLGSSEILNFNIAMLIGLIAGSLSSILIASQLWLDINIKNVGRNMNDKKRWFDVEDDLKELEVKGINK